MDATKATASMPAPCADTHTHDMGEMRLLMESSAPAGEICTCHQCFRLRLQRRPRRKAEQRIGLRSSEGDASRDSMNLSPAMNSGRSVPVGTIIEAQEYLSHKYRTGLWADAHHRQSRPEAWKAPECANRGMRPRIGGQEGVGLCRTSTLTGLPT